jgi:NAD(P)H-binding
MRIFLAGATGAIGRRLVPLLVESGHQVTGTTRSTAKADALQAAGVAPAVVDVFDAAALSRAVVAAHPDVVVHQLTDLPAGLDPSQMAEGTKAQRPSAQPGDAEPRGRNTGRGHAAAHRPRVLPGCTRRGRRPTTRTTRSTSTPTYARHQHGWCRGAGAFGPVVTADRGGGAALRSSLRARHRHRGCGRGAVAARRCSGRGGSTGDRKARQWHL